MGSANTDFCGVLGSVDFVPKMFDVAVLEVLLLPNNVDPKENPLDADLSLSKANENELAAETGSAVVESVFTGFITGVMEAPPKNDVGAFTDVRLLLPNGVVVADELAGAPNTNWLKMP